MMDFVVCHGGRLVHVVSGKEAVSIAGATYCLEEGRSWARNDGESCSIGTVGDGEGDN